VKNSKWLLVALVAVGALWGGLELRARSASGPQPLFSGFKAESAGRITIRAGARPVELKKSGGAWLVVSEDSLPAAPGPVEEVLAAVGALSRKDRISSKADRQAQYQVDSTGVAVTVEDGRGKTLASLVVGKLGPDYQSTYVRDARTGDVVLAQGRLGPVFNRGQRPWQNRRVFEADPAEVVEIGLAGEGGPVILKLGRDQQWYLSEPESASIDQAAATRLARSLAALECEAFAGRTARPEWGLGTEPAVWLRTALGATQGLILGGQDAAERRYAVREGGGPVYLIPGNVVRRVTPDLATLKPTPPEHQGSLEALDEVQSGQAPGPRGQDGRP